MSWRTRFTIAAVLVALLATGYGLAASPLLAAGAVGGIAVLAITLSWPTVVVAVMLLLGPLNLAFLTGGAKSLLPGLGGLDMSGIRLVGISAGLGMVVITRKDLLSELAKPAARWYVLFLVWAAATLAWSPAPLEGLRLFLKITYPLLLFLVVAAPERTTAEIRRLGDWTLWGATILMLADPIFVVNGSYAVESDEWLRVSLPGSHHNPFSFYLLAVFLMCVARFRARGQVRYLLLALIAVVWIALTLTRITFLASFVAIGMVFLYTAIADRNWRALVAAGVFAALLMALALQGVLVRTFGYMPTAVQLANLMLDPVGLYQSINWQGRENIWNILFLAFSVSPVAGSGLGASTAALQSAMIDLLAHNEYLRVAVDTGLIGVGLYFLAVTGWIKGSIGAMRTGVQGMEEFAMPALAIIAAWAVIAATDNAFDYYGPFTQYVAFLAASCVVVARQGARATAPAAPSGREAEPLSGPLPPLAGSAPAR